MRVGFTRIVGIRPLVAFSPRPVILHSGLVWCLVCVHHGMLSFTVRRRLWMEVSVGLSVSVYRWFAHKRV